MNPPTLQLDLRDLERKPRSWTALLPAGEGPWADVDVTFVEAPVAEMRARITGTRGVHVTGRLEAPVQVDCRRCLKPLRRTIELDLDLLYDRSVREQDSEGQVYPLEGGSGTLDLMPALREQVVLALPPYPLCREDCAGLCPRCGTDWNEGRCDCVLTEPDPRWDVLRKLRQGETATG
ncbi:MAG: DUF177 domain-containing protein [Candidatus Palauibacterales bacterium]|nr:DUF177 domain-containing protein [Candidatus Palauibacterales bacterium]MDP2529356.1 DUF177 domain-containing protein [Candidatus Palauibacterales bacterium]MDP2583237.1 DUF177 domain-containing protein [Candidatus Palauibacterales bacterium]